MSYLEHANITVNDPDKTAQRLVQLFDWRVRWSGVGMENGYTVHVGSKNDYLALYTNEKLGEKCGKENHAGHLNHVGIVVEDLQKVSDKAKEAGFEPFNHGEYEPGKRFYLMLEETLEIEVISYK